MSGDDANPSLKHRANGRAPGPRSVQVHHPLRGPGALPVPAAQLKRFGVKITLPLETASSSSLRGFTASMQCLLD